MHRPAFTEHSLPGLAWFAWVRNQTLRIGVLTGVYLGAVMVIAVLSANRAPLLDDFAEIRNWVFRVLFVLIAAIPIGMFRRAPARLFACGVLAWLLLALAYSVTGMFFENLFARLGKTPFHLFMLGVTAYAVVAVAAWVVPMVRSAWHQPISASRRRPY